MYYLVKPNRLVRFYNNFFEHLKKKENQNISIVSSGCFSPNKPGLFNNTVACLWQYWFFNEMTNGSQLWFCALLLF